MEFLEPNVLELCLWILSVYGQHDIKFGCTVVEGAKYRMRLLAALVAEDK